MIDPLIAALRGGSAEFDSLAAALGCQSLASELPTAATASAWRQILMSLPLDERSFNDLYPEEGFSSFVRSLSTWWTVWQHSGLQEIRHRNDTVLGFVGLLLLTLLSLAESDHRRNETGLPSSVPLNDHGQEGEDHQSPHMNCELCRELVRAASVRRVIEVLYDTGTNFSVKHNTAVRGDDSEWRSVVDFELLEFYRHGTTSIILYCPNEKVYGAEYALKLIIFPFLRFRGISEATNEYAQKYNPRGKDTYHSSSAKHVVGVLASSRSWILMPFIRGLTLAEFMANPTLVKAKLAAPEMSISDILRTSLSSVAEDTLLDKTGIARDHLRYLTIDQLMQAEAAVHSLRLPAKQQDRAVQVVMRTLEKFPGVKALERTTSARRQAMEGVSLEAMLTMGISLFLAMEDLRAIGDAEPGGDSAKTPPTPSSVHGDLTPSNIIVNDSANIAFTLIDLGRNYFYTLSLTGHGGVDSVFVAPEVRRDVRSIELADVYSVGQILQFIAMQGALPSQSVVDGLYQTIPLIARFIEDLIQENPRYRLMIFNAPDTPDGIDYVEFGKLFKEEVKAVISASKYGHSFANGGFLDTLKDIANPTNGAVRRQLNLWRDRSAADAVRDDKLARYTRVLFWWSAAAAFVGAATGLMVVMWFLRDTQWNWSGNIVELWSKLTGGNGADFPGLDALRATDYHVPDLSQNWPARLIGISYVLAGTKFYQNILAGQMPLLGRRPGAAGRLALRTEIAMRVMTVTAGLLVMFVTLYEARFWPIASAIGQTIIAFVNFTIFRFAVRSIDEARDLGISTAGVRGGRLPGLISYGEWVPAAIFYAVIVWVFGLLIYVHVLHDVGVYAVGVASINLFLFYVVKCGGESGRDIRIALSRACNAAERVCMIDKFGVSLRVSSRSRPRAVNEAINPLPRLQKGMARSGRMTGEGTR